MRLALILGSFFWFFVISSLTGCAALAGVKSYESGKNADGSEWSKWAFTQGFDAGIAINAVDEVNNQRGIKPGGVKNDE